MPASPEESGRTRGTATLVWFPFADNLLAEEGGNSQRAPKNGGVEMSTYLEPHAARDDASRVWGVGRRRISAKMSQLGAFGEWGKQHGE